jgi:dienelactone hydrolase
VNRPDLARYLSIRGARGPELLAGGSGVAFVGDLTGVGQAWTVPVPGGGWPEQVTFGADRVQSVHASPTEAGVLVFGRDAGGNERTGLHRVAPDGTGERPLAADPAVIHAPGAFTPDGRTFVYCGTARNGVDFDLHRIDVDGSRGTVVAELDGWNRVAGVSPDGRRALVVHARGSMDSDCRLVDLDTGRVKVAAAAGAEPARHLAGGFTGDGRPLVRSDRAGDFLRAGVIEPDGGWRWFGPQGSDADALAAGGCTVALTVNVEGASRLLLVDVDSGEQREVALPLGVVDALHVHPSGSHVAFDFSGPRHNPDVWIVDAAGGPPERVTRSTTAGIDLATLPEPVLDRVASFDGLDVPVWTYRPPGVERPPVVVWVHGGPEAQARPAFNPLFAYLVARGVAVVAPNVRGSTGYGRRFASLDDRRKRPDAVRDLIEVARWVKARSDLDGDRLAVTGGSYGGFMVLAAITAAPELWTAAVDIVGIANLVTFLENTSSYRRAIREAEYGSLADDRDFLAGISPIHSVEKITTPLLVIHGANDPRVPLGEAAQITERLTGLGREVELLVFPDEGHGIAKHANRLVAYGRMAEFLAEHLALD